MNARGYDIGEVTKIEATEFSPSDRVIKLKVTGTKGEKVFERENCRLIFSEVTLSQLYTISGGGTTTYPTLYIKSKESNNKKEINKIFFEGELYDAYSLLLDVLKINLYYD